MINKITIIDADLEVTKDDVGNKDLVGVLTYKGNSNAKYTREITQKNLLILMFHCKVKRLSDLLGLQVAQDIFNKLIFLSKQHSITSNLS